MCQCGCNSATFSKPTIVSSFLTPKFPNPCSVKIEEHHPNCDSNASTLDNPLSYNSSGKSYQHNTISIDDNRPRKLTMQDFRMERVLGKGSIGKVYLVRRDNGSELFAMKVMRKVDLQKDQLYENVILEKHILQINRHPFIVQLKNAFQSPSKLYLVMEYLPGGDLYTLIRRFKKFSELQTRFYAAEVILALEYLHIEMNIIYRDLKPENILMSAEGHVKLTDFGLSKQGEKAYTFAGTPEYLAPEIFLTKGYTKAVDYWSLGVLIYEMLVGTPPFTSAERNISQIEKLILINKPAFPSILSKEAVDLIKRLLELNPKKRIQCEDLKKHEFFQEINWEDLKNLKIKPPIQVDCMRLRTINKGGENLLEEEDTGNNLAYLPGISFNEMIE